MQLPGTGRTLDLQVVAVEEVVAVERLDEQVVEREPDRAAPVRVAAEQPRDATPPARTRRCTSLPIASMHERMVGVNARERSHSVRREELRFVEHVAKHAHEPVARRDGEQSALERLAVAVMAARGPRVKVPETM